MTYFHLPNTDTGGRKNIPNPSSAPFSRDHAPNLKTISCAYGRYRYFRYLGYLKPLPLLRYCFRNWESATRYSATATFSYKALSKRYPKFGINQSENLQESFGGAIPSSEGASRT